MCGRCVLYRVTGPGPSAGDEGAGGAGRHPGIATGNAEQLCAGGCSTCTPV